MRSEAFVVSKELNLTKGTLKTYFDVQMLPAWMFATSQLSIELLAFLDVEPFKILKIGK